MPKIIKIGWCTWTL